MQVKYNARRGFYFVIPGENARTKGGSSSCPLPHGFLLLEDRRGGAVQVTTHELNALNCRLRDAVADCLTLTEQVRHSEMPLVTVDVIPPANVLTVVGDIRPSVCSMDMAMLCCLI
jgi:hypothetical protein